MEEAFSGYYHPLPTEEEISALWNECVFVPDANVLLGLYRMFPQTAEEWLEMFAKLADRGQLWIPHQAALEYHRARPGVIVRETARHNKEYDHVQQLLSDALGELKKLHRGKRSPFEVDEEGTRLIEKIETTVSETRQALQGAKQQPLDRLDDDPLREKITSLFDDRLGSEYVPEELKEIYQEAEGRYDLRIRPGFRDAKKGGVTQYGDVVLWFQLIDYAKEVKKPIIFVTGERKDDWWLKASQGGEIIYPHPELIEEMEREAGVRFYMYEIDTFIDDARRYLDVSVSQEAIQQARDLKRQRELDTETLEAMQELYASFQELSEAYRQQLYAPFQQLSEAYRQQLHAPFQQLSEAYRQQLQQLTDSLYKSTALPPQDEKEPPDEEPEGSDSQTDARGSKS